jgi:glycosyltransferase involved in cell wall biosynthesis
LGGVAQHISGLSNYLRKNNHEVDIISSENTFTIPIKGLKNPSFMISSCIKTKLGKKYDIVHAHNIFSALAMKNTSAKKILTIHGIFSKQISTLYGRTIGRISESFEKYALGCSDAITVVSKEAQEYYSKVGYQVAQIPNAIDIESLPKDEDRRFEKQVIFAGRLSKEKGILNLLQIAKKLPSDINLVIVGSGPEEQIVKDAAKKYPNVHFLGYQTKENTIKLIRGSDALIQLSIVEGISSSILEAMATKTPIIATDVGGNRELLQNNFSGVLVNQSRPDEVAEKISDVFLHNEKYSQYANNAFEKIKDYDWSNIGKKYLELYLSLL